MQKLRTKPKVLFYIKDPHGGTGRFLEEITSLLDANKQYQYITVAHEETDGFDLKIMKIGIPVKKQVNFSVIKIVITFLNTLSFYRVVRKFQPDIIHSIDPYANLTTLFLFRYIFRSPMKIATSTHVNLVHHLKDGRNPVFSNLMGWLIKWLYPKTDFHITLTVRQKKQLSSRYGLAPDKIVVIPNFINVESVRRKSMEKITNQNYVSVLENGDNFNIVSVGRFDRQKNFESLFTVLPHLKKMIPSIKIFLLGDGPRKDEYIKYVMNKKMTDSVYLPGWQINPYPFLKHADVFVFLSNYEGFPYVMLEAMALGKPVIASDVPFGPKEILDNGKYGILLDKNELSALVKTLVMMARNKKMYRHYERASIERASDFDVGKKGRKYLNLYCFLSTVS